MKKYLWVKDHFAPEAAALRAAFEQRMENPKATRSDRFVWDFWHVPEQYTLVRTPADAFFPRAPYQAFLRRLGAWAQSTLGCSAITPPWLSYYVEGCEQKLHSDVPHGPWAFVFSLSPAARKFRGGETLLLRPEVLSYWSHFREAKDRELASFVQRIVPRFNRLVVFDPRIPHGVTRVEGTLDPRAARLVLHGWFTEPRPYLEGGLSARQAAPALDDAVGGVLERLSAFGLWHGILSCRLQISRRGEVDDFAFLADTLVPVDADPREGSRLRSMVRAGLQQARFPRSREATMVTLPLLFR